MFTLIASSLVFLLSATMLALSSSLPLQGLSLFILSISISIMTGTSISSLLAVYTILIYSSGLLVLLAYFVALSPNQKLNLPSIFIFFILLSIFTLIFLNTTFQPSLSHFSTELSSLNSICSITAPSSISLFSSIAIILILTMIAVVKVTSLSSKPMRPWK